MLTAEQVRQQKVDRKQIQWNTNDAGLADTKKPRRFPAGALTFVGFGAA
jgi:hypothetical protein